MNTPRKIQEKIQGTGVGLKRELIPQLQAAFDTPTIAAIDFVEIAQKTGLMLAVKRPSNWLGLPSATPLLATVYVYL